MSNLSAYMIRIEADNSWVVVYYDNAFVSGHKTFRSEEDAMMSKFAWEKWGE